MIVHEEIVEGIFIEESKNRFLCKVLVLDKIYECYVASASKLRNYLNLIGKKVLIKRNVEKNLRTQYSLFAIMYYNRYILLSLPVVNTILEEYLKSNFEGSIICREKLIEGYKSDFFIKDKENIVVEAKGIIAVKKNIVFPTVYSKRAIPQMNSILRLLKRGWIAQYYFISLSPIVKTININKEELYTEYVDLLLRCIENGMIVKGFNIFYENGEIKIKDKINVII